MINNTVKEWSIIIVSYVEIIICHLNNKQKQNKHTYTHTLGGNASLETTQLIKGNIVTCREWEEERGEGEGEEAHLVQATNQFSQHSQIPLR